MKHNPTISVAKGIGIILMVIGHSMGYYPNMEVTDPPFLQRFIYMFHMPLFFFISGYLFNEKYLDSKKQFIIHKLNSLWRPFVLYNLIFLIFHNVLFHLNIYATAISWNDFARKLFDVLLMSNSEQLLGAFWFLQVLLLASFIVLFSLYFLKRLCAVIRPSFYDEHKLAILLFLGCAYLLAAYVIGVRTLLAVAYFISGMIYAKVPTQQRYHNGIGILCLSLTVVFTCLTTYQYDITVRGIRVFAYYLVSLVGSIGVIAFASTFKGSLQSAFDYLGKKTMPILIWHFSVFKLVSAFFILCYQREWTSLSAFPVADFQHTYWWILYAVVGVGLPVLSAAAYDKIKRKPIN